jgi:hypothetical protein
VGVMLSSCTIPDARTWRWVPVFPIRRSPISTTHIQIRATAVENHMPSVPIRSLAGCIMNTSSRPGVRDLIFAEHRDANLLSYQPPEKAAAGKRC